MKFTHLLIVVLVAAITSIGVVHYAAPTAAIAEKKETAYERVMRTGTLRCGYGTWDPGVYKDPQTGEMRGLFVELTNAIGKLNGINVEWASEVDWGQIATAVQTGKVDAFCAGMAADATHGKALAFTNPLSYWTFDALVRADDTRFSGTTVSLSDLNKAGYATAYTEGDVLETLAKTELPNVKGVPLPPLGTPADNVMNVMTGKTDFVIFPKVMYQQFEQQNPGKLHYLKIEPPLRAYGNVIAIDINEPALQQLLNAGVNELVNSGAYQQIMTKYGQQYPGAFLPVTTGYKQPE